MADHHQGPIFDDDDIIDAITALNATGESWTIGRDDDGYYWAHVVPTAPVGEGKTLLMAVSRAIAMWDEWRNR